MLKSGMNVMIRRHDWNGSIDIYLAEKREDGTIWIGKPMDILFERYQEGEELERRATIHIDSDYSDDFLKALADELDSKGVKTDSDAKIAGTLEATRSHLQDMRTIVFKDYPDKYSNGAN